MTALFEIIQYEVQVFESGHWHVRARFPRSDRDRAFTEARRVDLNEMLPARVVRDIYDPQSGRNQEYTIYQSDRAKAQGARGPAARPGRESHAERPAPKRAAARPTGRPAPLVFRATMALGVGLLTALLVTSIVTWIMTTQPESFASVLARTPSAGTPTTLFVAVALLSVFTMLRGPLGISRLARTLGAHFEQAPAPQPANPRAASGPRPALVRSIVPARKAPPADESHFLTLAQVTLARFFADAAPENSVQALADATGRRGLAIYLAGGVSELAAQLEMPAPLDLLGRLSPDALRTDVEDVLDDARALDHSDSALFSSGRAGMKAYLNTPEERPSMAAALIPWHKAVRAGTQMPAALREERP